MHMINLDEVGAHADIEGRLVVRFGIYLPNITAAKGYQLIARVIHEKDQFAIEIPAKNFLLTFDEQHPLGLWSGTIDLSEHKDTVSHFGAPGMYLYRYTFLQKQQPGGDTSNQMTLPVFDPGATVQRDLTANVVTLFITDPFARDTGIGKLSAFTVSEQPILPFAWTDADFAVPELDDLIVYELQVEEFDSTFDGVAQRLDYLLGLGVNALELMSITTVPQIFDWGYGPLHFFAPEDRWGGLDGLKRLVDACHGKGIAVILDVVYQHVSADFAYDIVYKDSHEVGPMGTFPNGDFGPKTTFEGMPFTQEYFRTANRYWLNECHIDGFRYDNVAGYYDGPSGQGYAELVYNTYQDSAPISRFQSARGFSRIIQCAEYLVDPPAILRDTYSNATWQDGLLDKAQDMARHNYVDGAFVNLLNPYISGYPATRDFDGVQAPVAPFQYFNSHDHEHLITSFGTAYGIGGQGDVQFGIRANFAKLQPFAIALYTCQGVPALWQGEEFAENYTLPAGGNARISFRRSTHWEYFYDEYGQTLVRLYRVMARLRRRYRALRSRSTYYFNEHSNPGAQVVAYQRYAAATQGEAEQYAIIFLNFSDSLQSIAVPFPKAGAYREMIDDDARAKHLDIIVASAGELALPPQPVPSHYGQVWVSL
jgi:maltooligosyltrehalose trehalohydrolase